MHLIFSTKNRAALLRDGKWETSSDPAIGRPFRARNPVASVPGALPQANVCCPFGAKSMAN